jgi:hypothetical protein
MEIGLLDIGGSPPAYNFESEKQQGIVGRVAKIPRQYGDIPINSKCHTRTYPTDLLDIFPWPQGKDPESCRDTATLRTAHRHKSLFLLKKHCHQQATSRLSDGK